MNTVLRTWLAGGLLAFSVLTLTLPHGPGALADRAALLMFVVFAHAWVLATGERACEGHGGLRARRFPLGPRLMGVRPGLFPQLLLLCLLLGLVTWTPAAAIVALAVLMMASVDTVRRGILVVLPIALLFHGLSTMEEFHGFSDLLGTATNWGAALISWCLVALLFAGPLLRTDVSGRLPRPTATVAMLAALPGYGGAAWLFTRTPLANTYPDLVAVAAVLLAGSLCQSLLLAVLGPFLQLHHRDTRAAPPVDIHHLGQALLALLLPLLAFVGLAVISPGPIWTEHATSAQWAGILALCIVVPAVPAAAFVAAGLDRLDGRTQGRRAQVLAVACLLAWIGFGPRCLAWFYGEAGAAVALAEHFFDSQPFWLAERTAAGRVVLVGLPLDDLCRSAGLMLLACAGLATRYLRTARRGQVAVGWGTLLLLVLIQAGATAVLVPWMGPVGAPLGATVAATAMLAADLAMGPALAAPGGATAAGRPLDGAV